VAPGTSWGSAWKSSVRTSTRTGQCGVPMSRVSFSMEIELIEDMLRPCVEAGRDTWASRLVGRSQSPCRPLRKNANSCQGRRRTLERHLFLPASGQPLKVRRSVVELSPMFSTSAASRAARRAPTCCAATNSGPAPAPKGKPASPFVFISERRSPFTTAGFSRMGRARRRRRRA
jgi:hypothetical protein